MTGEEFLKEAIRQMKGKTYRTMSDLAKRAGISQGNLSLFMNDDPSRQKKTITLSVAWKLFEALGIIMPKIPDIIDEEKIMSGSVSNTASKLENVSSRAFQLEEEIKELKERLDKNETITNKLIQSIADKDDFIKTMQIQVSEKKSELRGNDSSN